MLEDTRISRRLLSHYNINTPLSPFHAYNEHKVLFKYIEKLKKGVSLALISDAGTPAISDPGFLLVENVLKKIFKWTV